MERMSLSRNERAQTKCLRSQSVEKIQFYTKQQPRGSAHQKAFAAQTHQSRGRVPRF